VVKSRHESVRFEETATFFSAGAQADLGGDWRFGGGIGFEQTNLDSGSNATSDGDSLHLGAVIKYNPGPWLLAATLSGGHGWIENERNVSFGGFNATATSSTDPSFVSGRFTAAYLAGFGNWYLKPQIDVAVTHLERDGYSETDTGGIALNVSG
jgi:outer membrane autotransporter protein